MEKLLQTLKAKQGQLGGGLVAALIGVMVAVIVGVAVAIPVVTDVINNASLTGTTATIVGYIPLLIAVVILVAIVGIIAMR